MPGNQNAFQKAMNAGHSAAWDQDWQKAAGYYRTALEEFPDNPLALSSLGLAFYEMQDIQNALKCYQRAAVISPKDAVPYEKMARIYESLGEYTQAAQTSLKAAELHLGNREVEKAIDNWLRVLVITPDHLPTRQRLAAVYERTGRKPEAVSEYIACASIFQRSGDLTRALKAVEYAARLMPESQDARFALHTLRSSQLLPRPGKPKNIQLTAQTKSEPGVPQLQGETARQSDPIEETVQRAKVQLAGLLFDQSEETGAGDQTVRRGLNMITRGVAGTDTLGKSSASRARIVLHLGQAIDSLSEKDDQQAAAELEKALDLGLRHPAAYFILGMLGHARTPERAQRYLQEAIHHADFALGANLLNARIYQSSGLLSQAAAAYLQALSLADAEIVGERFADELRQAYEPMIDALSSETDETALQSICSTISGQLNRSDWRSFLLLARQQIPQSGDQAPLPVAELLLESRSGQAVEAVARVRQLAQRGLARTSMEEAYYAVQFAPTYLPIHVQMAELLLQDGHTEDAVRKMNTVAELYQVRGEPSRAARLYRRILQISPMDLKVRTRLIDLLSVQQKTEEALAEYMDLADIHYRLAELDQAREAYMTALKLAQKSPNNRKWAEEILLKVADIDLQRLNLRQAVRIYEQIRIFRPDDPAVRAQIVQLYLRLGQEAAAVKEVDAYLHVLENNGLRAQGITFLKNLVDENDGHIDLRRRLADLYVRNNEVPEAVAQLDAAAETYMSANRTYEAINMLETIIALNPSNVEEYRAALAELRRSSLRN